jgi:hypothetical protein
MLVFFIFTMGILKMIYPENVGLFTSPSGLPILGFVDAEGFTEHLGWWLIPVALFTSAGLFTLLTRLIDRFHRHR